MSTSPLYRISVEQFEAMVAAGVFTRPEKVHLIKGYLVAKMPQTPPHATASSLLRTELVRILAAERYHVSENRPIRLPSRDSEPDSDCCVVRGAIRDYVDRHPGPDDVALVAEVADAGLADDRMLAVDVYGPAGIPVCWIVNLVDRQVEVSTKPGPDGYQSRVDFSERQTVPVVIDGHEFGRIAVADILPSRPAHARAEGDGA